MTSQKSLKSYLRAAYDLISFFLALLGLIVIVQWLMLRAGWQPHALYYDPVQMLCTSFNAAAVR